MIVSERFGKGQGFIPDFCYPVDFPFPHLIHTNHDGDPNMILFGIRELNGRITSLSRLGQLGVHRDRQPFLLFLLELMERPHGLFIRHTRNHSVRRLVIELNEVEMGINFR